MKLKTLNVDYIQKSRLFLYPLLGIKRGVSTTPIETYTSWEDKYCFTDNKLICRYYLRDDQDFKIFEEVKLRGNALFHSFHELEDGTGVYIFDLSKIEKDFWKIIRGQYSQLSIPTKNKIKAFFKNKSEHYVYIQSYLDPKNYYPMYAQLYNCELASLKTAKELCSKPDLVKEKLELGVKVMCTQNNPLNLQP